MDASRAQGARPRSERLQFAPRYKRLERGTYSFAAQMVEGVRSVEIDVHELSMLLEGIDVTRARVSQRWEPPAHARTT